MTLQSFKGINNHVYPRQKVPAVIDAPLPLPSASGKNRPPPSALAENCCHPFVTEKGRKIYHIPPPIFLDPPPPPKKKQQINK